MWDLLSLGEANIISSLKSYDINIGATKHTGILINSQEHDRVSHSLTGEAAWGYSGFNCTNFLNNFSQDSVGDSRTRRDIIDHAALLCGNWININIPITHNICWSSAHHDNHLHVMGISNSHMVNQYHAYCQPVSNPRTNLKKYNIWIWVLVFPI